MLFKGSNIVRLLRIRYSTLRTSGFSKDAFQVNLSNHQGERLGNANSGHISTASGRLVRNDGNNNPYARNGRIKTCEGARGACPAKLAKPVGMDKRRRGFTIIESVLTLVIIASSLTVIFSLQTKLMKSVFGTHDLIEHLIGVRNYIVKDDQEEYYKQGKGLEEKVEGSGYSITYAPKPAKQFPALAAYKNIIVEKFTLSSKSVFINSDEFVFFRFNPEGKS